MAKQAHFSIFQRNPKYMPHVGWAEESKTGLGYEIGPSHQKCHRKPSLQSVTNPAVDMKVEMNKTEDDKAKIKEVM